jgi:hypothetical protein
MATTLPAQPGRANGGSRDSGRGRWSDSRLPPRRLARPGEPCRADRDQLAGRVLGTASGHQEPGTASGSRTGIPPAGNRCVRFLQSGPPGHRPPPRLAVRLAPAWVLICRAEGAPGRSGPAAGGPAPGAGECRCGGLPGGPEGTGRCPVSGCREPGRGPAGWARRGPAPGGRLRTGRSGRDAATSRPGRERGANRLRAEDHPAARCRRGRARNDGRPGTPGRPGRTRAGPRWPGAMAADQPAPPMARPSYRRIVRSVEGTGAGVLVPGLCEHSGW